MSANFSATFTATATSAAIMGVVVSPRAWNGAMKARITTKASSPTP